MLATFWFLRPEFKLFFSIWRGLKMSQICWSGISNIGRHSVAFCVHFSKRHCRYCYCRCCSIHCIKYLQYLQDRCLMFFGSHFWAAKSERRGRNYTSKRGIVEVGCCFMHLLYDIECCQKMPLMLRETLSLTKSVVWFFSPETSAGTFGRQCCIWRLTAPVSVKDMWPGIFLQTISGSARLAAWDGFLCRESLVRESRIVKGQEGKTWEGLSWGLQADEKKWSESWTSVVWTMAKASIISCFAWKWWSWLQKSASFLQGMIAKLRWKHHEAVSKFHLNIALKCVFSTYWYQILWKCLFAALTLQEVLQTKMTPCDDPSTTQWNWNCGIQSM